MAPAMKAWQHSVTTKPVVESIQLVQDRIRPGQPLGDSDILVEVIILGLDPGDFQLAEAGLTGRVLRSLPAVPCMDFSGRIVSVGGNVQDLKPDDLVRGRINPLKDPIGSLVEYVQTNYNGCAIVPLSVDMDQAAGVGTDRWPDCVPEHYPLNQEGRESVHQRRLRWRWYVQHPDRQGRRAAHHDVLLDRERGHVQDARVRRGH